MYAHAFDRRSHSHNHATSSVREYIKNKGSVSVEEAQQIALYHPEFGYYFNNNVIGQQGDFITAPEISQLFGEMLGLWCIAQWQEAKEPASVHVIELGPGRGTLMQDILRIGKRYPRFFDSLTVSCVEVCHYLEQQQRNSLQEYPFIYWYQSLSNAPQGADFTIILANEFFDCLPIRQFVRPEERMIRYSESEHDLVFAPPANPKSIKEQCPIAEEIMKQILSQIKPGVALIVDYGDDTLPESRYGDTLQAVFQHQKVNVLQSLGFADLSHQVDFHQLRTLCSNHRYQQQGNFLLRLGIEQRLEKLMKVATAEQQFILTTGATRLVAPTEMGQRFKVLEIFS